MVGSVCFCHIKKFRAEKSYSVCAGFKCRFCFFRRTDVCIKRKPFSVFCKGRLIKVFSKEFLFFAADFYCLPVLGYRFFVRVCKKFCALCVNDYHLSVLYFFAKACAVKSYNRRNSVVSGKNDYVA